MEANAASTAALICGEEAPGRLNFNTQTTMKTGMHRNLALGMTVFLTKQGVTAILEIYVDIGC